MNKKRKIILIIILVILFVLGYIVYSQRQNINALITSFKYNQEQVQEKLEENQMSVRDYLEKNGNIKVRDLTEEESKALNEGTLSEEEVIKIITSTDVTVPDENKDNKDANIKHKNEGINNKDKNKEKTNQNNNSNADKPSNDKPVDKKTDNKKEEASQKVAESIAKLYIQKSYYLSKLDGVEAEARARYEALPKGTRKAQKQDIISSYMGTVSAWEKECDGIVYGILDEVKAALKESGQSMDIAKKIEESYINEKVLKKSYFINRYMD